MHCIEGKIMIIGLAPRAENVFQVILTLSEIRFTIYHDKMYKAVLAIITEFYPLLN
jgi:hypothetical protein